MITCRTFFQLAIDIPYIVAPSCLLGYLLQEHVITIDMELEKMHEKQTDITL